MRVLVVTSDVPFVEGGHRVIARSLVRALEDAGHEAEMLTTPQNRFGRQLSAYLATWLTDVQVAGDGDPVDHVVSLRFPSYAIRHPSHAVWLNHRMREYYDLWEGFRRGLGLRGRVLEGIRRRMLHLLDRRLLSRRRVLAQSRTIQERLRRWGRIPSEVVYPPPPPRAYRCEDYDGAILSVARLTPLKRVDLLVEAATRVPGLALRIAGEGPEKARLRALASSPDARGRIEFLGHLTDAELTAEYARCSAVWYGARAEDYGLVTLEAFSSSKPVITCTDSGGPAELVRHGETGLVVEPETDEVAGALERLGRNAELTATMGRAALRVADRHSWSRAVERLLP